MNEYKYLDPPKDKPVIWLRTLRNLDKNTKMNCNYLREVVIPKGSITWQNKGEFNRVIYHDGKWAEIKEDKVVNLCFSNTKVGKTAKLEDFVDAKYTKEVKYIYDNDFQVGQYLTFIDTNRTNYLVKPGAIGLVTKNDLFSKYIDIKWIKNHNGQIDGRYFRESFRISASEEVKDIENTTSKKNNIIEIIDYRHAGKDYSKYTTRYDFNYLVNGYTENQDFLVIGEEDNLLIDNNVKNIKQIKTDIIEKIN